MHDLIEHYSRIALGNQAAQADILCQSYEYLIKKFADLTNKKAAVVNHIVRHFRTKVEPNGFKAQVVVFDRECCVRYKAVMDELIGPETSAIVMTAASGDPLE